MSFLMSTIKIGGIPIIAGPLLLLATALCSLCGIISLLLERPLLREWVKLLSGVIILLGLLLYGREIMLSLKPAWVFAWGKGSMEQKLKVWGHFFGKPSFLWNSFLWGSIATFCLFLKGLFFINPLKRIFLDKSYRVREKVKDPSQKASLYFENKELLKRLGKSKGGLPLGKHPKRNQIIYYEPTSQNGLREGHHIVVAGSRGGKTTGCIIPAVMDWNGPLFVIDVKREIFPQTAPYRQHIGKKVAILDPFGEEIKDCWNPLEEIREDYVTEDSRVLAEALIEEEYSAHKHFSDWARMVLATAIEVHLTEKILPKTLKSVMDELLGKSFEETLKSWEHSSVISARQHARTLGKVFASKSGEGASFLTTLERGLSWLSLPRMERLTQKSTFSLKQMLQGKLDVFLAIPTGQVMQTRGFIRLMTNQVIRTISNASGVENVRENVLVVLDEAPVLGRLESMKEAFTLGAGWGMSALLVTQNISQLARIWKEDLGTFFENAASIRAFNLGLGERHKGSAEFIGSLLPEIREVKRTSTNKTSGRILGIPDSETVSADMKPALKGEELIRLNRDQMLVLLRGERPLTLKLIQSFNDKHYALHLKPNPTRERK